MAPKLSAQRDAIHLNSALFARIRSLYGARDSLGPGHRLFATLLPTAQVRTIDGAHDWPTWRALWRDLCFNTDFFRAEKTTQTTVVSAAAGPAL